MNLRMRVLAAWVGLSILVVGVAGELRGDEAESRAAASAPAAQCAEKPSESQWVAVVTPGLRGALEPLAEHRASQGYKVVLIDVPEAAREPDGGAKLCERVRKACEGWAGQSCVLLVGAPLPTEDVAEGCYVPALAGRIGRTVVRPTDNPYGCADGAFEPRVAVGRFPARTVGEAEGMVRRVLAWEREVPPGAWKRRMVLLAGSPAFNPIVDRMVENLAMGYFERLPKDYTANAIYFNPISRFAVPADEVVGQAETYLDKGQLLTVYVGHSAPSGFWFQGWSGPYFSRRDWARIKLPAARGLFVTVGCWGARYDATDGESYGLAAMRNPDGPVAVIGSDWIDYAAMAMMLTEGLLTNLPNGMQDKTLGTLWLEMKRHLAAGPLDPLTFRMLDAVDGDPNVPPEVQRPEHLEMFQLLGDPALVLPAVGHAIEIACAEKVSAGQTLVVRCDVPRALEGARGRVVVERRLTSMPLGLEPVPDEDGAEQAATIRENHRLANTFELCGTDVQVQEGKVEARLVLPDALPWTELLVRVWLAGKGNEGLGTRLVQVERAPAAGKSAPEDHSGR